MSRVDSIGEWPMLAISRKNRQSHTKISFFRSPFFVGFSVLSFSFFFPASKLYIYQWRYRSTTDLVLSIVPRFVHAHDLFVNFFPLVLLFFRLSVHSDSFVYVGDWSWPDATSCVCALSLMRQFITVSFTGIRLAFIFGDDIFLPSNFEFWLLSSFSAENEASFWPECGEKKMLVVPADRFKSL